MFQSSKSLEDIDLSSLNTSNVTEMSQLFEGCEGLKHVKFGKIDVSKVTTMAYMFHNCKSLESIDLSGLNPESLESMYYMFNYCSSLRHINLDGFATPSIKDLNSAFAYCTALEEMDLRSMKTFNTANAGNLFLGCTNLKYVNMSGIDLSKNSMFYNCSNILTIDMSRCAFDMNGKVRSNKNGMFGYIPTMTLIYLPTGSTKEFFGSDAYLLEKDYYHGNYNIVTDEDGDDEYSCDDFRMYTDIVFRISTPFTAGQACFGRSFDETDDDEGDGYKRSTVYLPFAFDASAFGKVYAYKGLTADHDGVVLGELTMPTTEANTPYVIDPNGEKIAAYNVLVHAYKDTEATGENQFLGVCQKGYVPMGAFCYDANDGKLKRVTAEDKVVIRVARAYFLLPDADQASAARGGLSLCFADGATGVTAIDDDDDAEWYTVGGVRLNGKPTKHGIYIHHGRKVAF